MSPYYTDPQDPLDQMMMSYADANQGQDLEPEEQAMEVGMDVPASDDEATTDALEGMDDLEDMGAEPAVAPPQPRLAAEADRLEAATTPAGQQRPEQPWSPVSGVLPTRAQRLAAQFAAGGKEVPQAVKTQAMRDRERQLGRNASQRQQMGLAPIPQAPLGGQEGQQQLDPVQQLIQEKPWVPGGQFQPTFAQRQLESVYQKGGQISNDIIQQARWDREAQEQGLSRDYRVTPAEQHDIGVIADQNVSRSIPEPRRSAIVEARKNLMLQGLQHNKYRMLVREAQMQQAAFEKRLQQRDVLAKEARAKQDKIETEQRGLETWRTQQKEMAEAKAPEKAAAEVKQKEQARVQAYRAHMGELEKELKAIKDDKILSRRPLPDHLKDRKAMVAEALRRMEEEQEALNPTPHPPMAKGPPYSGPPVKAPDAPPAPQAPAQPAAPPAAPPPAQFLPEVAEALKKARAGVK